VALAPRLIDVALPADPAGAVLVLHGGASRAGSPMVSPTQLSVLRMIPIARRIARTGRRRLAVFRLLNTTRGWDTSHTPVDDARWALARIRERLGAVPTCLVGHSLGGRAALLAAGEARSVVALAPWVYPTDVAEGLDGQDILIVHGARDRVASPQRSAALARALAGRASVGYVCVEGGTHAMVGRHRLFDGLAASFAAATLLGRPVGGPLARLAGGERWITV
jgi:pimeloyl-ACP methyl ester carboxylesterase